MAEVTHLKYEPMEEMIRVFKQGVEQLENTMQEMNGIANVLADGGLKGQAGEALVDAIQGTLCPALSRLVEKFNEEASDVQKAIDIFRGQQDPSIASDFG